MADTLKGFNKFLLSAGGLAVVLLLMVLVNFLFAGLNLRWDTTEENLYSLSDNSKNILADLEEDVTIKVFYSKNVVNLPVSIKNFARRMIDFLKEYEYFSSGKVAVEVYDPKIDSEEEEWAQKFGIEGIDLPSGERIYLGLVAVAGDQEESIAALDPSAEQQLEYSITRIIARVQTPTKPKIGIISGLPIFGASPMAFNMQNPTQAMAPWFFITELRKTYDVQEINPSSKQIESGFDLLLLLHPKNLNNQLQYAVDQHLLQGGRLIVCIDPFAIMDRSPGPVKASYLQNLFKSWGFTMEATKAVADFGFATRLRTQDNRIENNPFWISTTPIAFNRDDMITSDLETMLLPVAGGLKKNDTTDLTYEPLLVSSVNSAMQETFKLRFGVGEIRKDFVPSSEKYDLAAKISGNFKTSFPDGPPAADDQIQNPTPDPNQNQADAATDSTRLTESQKPGTIIVVADADFLFDGHYVENQNFLGFNISRVFNDNLNFLLNACEVLSGNPELIGIRSRGTFDRPFTRVQALQRKAQDRWREKEQTLLRKVEETNQKISALEKQKDASQQFLLSEEQEAEIRKFKEEKVRINRELKIVRRNLRSEIESLGNKVKFANIFLMPFLVAIVGIAYGLHKRRKSQTPLNK